MELSRSRRCRKTYKTTAAVSDIKTQTGGVIIHSGLIRIAKQYDVVLIPGWMPVSCSLLLFYMGITRRKFIFSCDTICFHKSMLHRIIYAFIKKANAYYVPGKRTKSELIKEFAIPADNIFEGSYMTDQSLWEKQVSSVRAASAKPVGSFYLLFVGKFVQTRNIPLLIAAVRKVRESNKNIKLILIGCGAWYSDIVADFIQSDPDGIMYKEKVSYAELPRYYALADCYVHPGWEPYSLALVQAAVAGIPVVSSLRVGAVDDYVVDRANGIVLEVETEDSFAQSILTVHNAYDYYSVNAKNIAAQKLQKRNVNFAVSQLEKAFQS